MAGSKDPAVFVLGAADMDSRHRRFRPAYGFTVFSAFPKDIEQK
jgi:hypothetical protein